MFIREKKVGSTSYVQLVESSRTKAGPRSKVVASFGRIDKLRESGQLRQLAASFAALAQEGILLPDAESVRVEPVCKKTYQKLIVRNILVHCGLDEQFAKIAGFKGDTDAFIGLFAAFVFNDVNHGSINGFRDFHMPDRAAEDLSNLLTRGNTEDDNVIIHIAKTGRDTNKISLTKGEMTATAVNSFGDVLMTTRWLDHLPLMEMIVTNVERLLLALPGRKLTMVLCSSITGADRLAARRQLVANFEKSGVRFVTPLREPGVKMKKMPDEILELSLENPPFNDVGTFRYLRAEDKTVSNWERQVREARLSRIAADKSNQEMHHRANAKASKILGDMEIWDGQTVLVSNLVGEPAKVFQIYLAGQKASAYQSEIAGFGDILSRISDLPRDARVTVELTALLTLMAHHCRKILTDMAGCIDNGCDAWSRLEEALGTGAPFWVNYGTNRTLAMGHCDGLAEKLHQKLEITFETLSAEFAPDT